MEVFWKVGNMELCSERWQCGSLSDVVSLQRGDEGRPAEKCHCGKWRGKGRRQEAEAEGLRGNPS